MFNYDDLASAIRNRIAIIVLLCLVAGGFVGGCFAHRGGYLHMGVTSDAMLGTNVIVWQTNEVWHTNTLVILWKTNIVIRFETNYPK